MGKCHYGVPWSSLIGNDRLFVDIEYVLIGFHFQHPHEMQKAKILEFLHHILMQQEKYSSLDLVFKFNKITSSRKRKSNIIDSQYNAPVEKISEATQGEQQRKAKRKDPQQGQTRFQLEATHETPVEPITLQPIQNQVLEDFALIPPIEVILAPVPKGSSSVTNNKVSLGPTVHAQPKPHDKTKSRAPGTLYQQIMYADDNSICYSMPSGSGALSSADLAIVAKSRTPPLMLHPCDSSNDADGSIHRHENLGAPSDYNNPTLDLTSEYILKMSSMLNTKSTDPEAQVLAVKKSSQTKKNSRCASS